MNGNLSRTLSILNRVCAQSAAVVINQYYIAMYDCAAAFITDAAARIYYRSLVVQLLRQRCAQRGMFRPLSAPQSRQKPRTPAETSPHNVQCSLRGVPKSSP